MASAKEKALRERLDQIKGQAAALAVDAENKTAANLAEEAAELGLELADLLEKKKGG
jgi:hypothetical protein